MTVYLSGPITGKRDNNRRAFEKAHSKIVAALNELEKYKKIEEWKIVNPLGIAGNVEYQFDCLNYIRYKKIKPQWEDYMRACIKELCDADCVFLIKGREKSRGATLERHIAENLQISCVESTEELMKLIKART
jgi:hypothetical protein